jgi:prevent-host-death family protein
MNNIGPIASVPASEARSRLSELCDRVAYGGERVLITRRKKARVALVSAKDLELLQALENELDLELARKALRRAKKEGTIPLEEVARDLGVSP